MKAKRYTYHTNIQETSLDAFGHVNNAAYLVLLEEARWDLLNQNNYGIQKILETQLGPTILEVNIRFMKELRAREAIRIETEVVSYAKKIGVVRQTIFRDDVTCCVAEFVIGLFSVKERKLVMPTREWLAIFFEEMSPTLSDTQREQQKQNEKNK